MKMYLTDKLGKHYYVKDCDCQCHVIFKHCHCDCDGRGLISEYDITGDKKLVYPFQ